MQHSNQIRCARQLSGVKGDALVALFPQYGRSTIFKHAKKPLCDEVTDNRKFNQGRPRKLTARDARKVVNTIPFLRKTEKSFSSKRIQFEASMGKVSNRTVRRTLNRTKYDYLRTRKKGVLLSSDLPKRVRWCRAAKRFGMTGKYWTDEVNFYCDGTGFEFTSHPMDQCRAPSALEWRRRDEGLTHGCTAKGKKEGQTNVNFIVGIAHDRGVVLCQRYEGQMTGGKFARIIRDHFPTAFAKCKKPERRHFQMDGCPRQNSKKAREACKAIGATSLIVPPRSADLAVIENFFNLAKKGIRQEAIAKRIQKETQDEFAARCAAYLNSYPTAHINALIESMDRRIDSVIKARGQRIKY